MILPVAKFNQRHEFCYWRRNSCLWFENAQHPVVIGMCCLLTQSQVDSLVPMAPLAWMCCFQSCTLPLLDIPPPNFFLMNPNINFWSMKSRSFWRPMWEIKHDNALNFFSFFFLNAQAYINVQADTHSSAKKKNSCFVVLQLETQRKRDYRTRGAEGILSRCNKVLVHKKEKLSPQPIH